MSILAVFCLLAETMTITADRVAADNVTKAFTATGHVHATVGVMSVKGESATRDAEGLAIFSDPTSATTCTNDTCLSEGRICHWRVAGEIEYKQEDYVILRNAWLHYYEIPCFYLPYLYYPLNTDCGFSWMPGYIGTWGAFLLTKYAYNIAGDPHHQDNTWWLKGDTRLDLRYKQGVAFGEDLSWNLGDFGAGKFQFYYAWDNYAERKYNVGGTGYNSGNWGSLVDRNRYGIGFEHRWEATERDIVSVRGNYYSDSYFRQDFYRKSLFDLKTQYLSYENNGVFWEHLENAWSFGVEASGRLNKFYSMTDRLPEVYLDVNPVQVFGLPINYETENRVGWLRRNPAEYGNGDPNNAYSFQPGPWAEYDSMRLDTYHRFTAPFKSFEETLSVVPRLAYRGTGWSQSGFDNLNGQTKAGEAGSAFRSIGEVGLTFAGRGVGMVNDTWQHMMEPYMDVLLQQAWYHGIGDGKRPYVFDSIDASSTWEDQFAGRSRNLPYSYYGFTPGMRNAWSEMDEKGNFREYLDFDVYLACQFNSTDFIGENESHKLAKLGQPNYGKSGPEFAPGARLRWSPIKDSTLGVRGEYDSDNNRIAYAQVGWNQRLCEDFKYYANYTLRDHRYWDFSSYPYVEGQMKSDEMDMSRLHMANVGFEHKICEWLQWGPHIRWDLRDNELDTVGAWIDYLTDCIGYRLILEYENEYTLVDGYKREDEWSIGFYIYLRAFGSDSGSVFMGR